MNCLIVGLIKNELIKIFKRKKLLAGVIIFFIASFWILAGSINRYDDTQHELERAKNSVTMSENSRDEIVDTQQKAIDDYIKSKEWSIEQLKDSYKEDMKSMEIKNPDKSDEIINCQYNLIKYLDDNDLRPTTTIDLDSNGIMQKSISSLPLIAILVVILITSDSISNEFNSGTLKLLVTKPFSRSKIILSKFFASVIMSLGILFIFEILLYVIGVLLKGYATLSYPESIYPLCNYSNNLNIEIQRYLNPILGSSTILPQWQVFLRCFILQIFFIAAISSISILLSIVVKRDALVALIGIFVAFLSISISMSDTLGVKYWSYFLPYNYFNSLKVITRIGILETGASYLNNITGIIILLAYTVICLFISCKLINKKNIYL